MCSVQNMFVYLCQRLDAGVDVTTRNLRDDKVDGGSCAVVQFIKVWRDRTHPLNTKLQRSIKPQQMFTSFFLFVLLVCARLIIRTEVVYLGSGIMMGSSSSSSLCWTRSGSSHTLPWSISIISRSSWNSLGMDGCRDSVCCAF